MQKEWKILIGLVLLIALFILLTPKPQPKPDKVTVKQIILEDLHNKYPNANVGILSIAKKTNGNNETYYNIKSLVVLNYKTPCPERMSIYYNYPDQNFVPQPPEYITKNCKVCVNELCTILYPEEAVIASHTFSGTESVAQFLEKNPDAKHTVSKVAGGNGTLWLVNWTSETQGIGVQLYDNGTIEYVTSLVNLTNLTNSSSN